MFVVKRGQAYIAEFTMASVVMYLEQSKAARYASRDEAELVAYALGDCQVAELVFSGAN